MITKEDVQHIAGLARIGVDDKDLEKFAADLSAILDWVEQLKEVDVEGIEPTAHITGMQNMTKDDLVKEFSNKDNIIKLFPEKKDRYDKVKSVL